MDRALDEAEDQWPSTYTSIGLHYTCEKRNWKQGRTGGVFDGWSEQKGESICESVSGCQDCLRRGEAFLRVQEIQLRVVMALRGINGCGVDTSCSRQGCLIVKCSAVKEQKAGMFSAVESIAGT